MEQDFFITGECRYKVHVNQEDPCYGCGICSIDGNDYSDMKRDLKP